MLEPHGQKVNISDKNVTYTALLDIIWENFVKRDLLISLNEECFDLQKKILWPPILVFIEDIMGENVEYRPKIQIQRIIAAKLSKYTTIRLACDIKDTHGHLRNFFGGNRGIYTSSFLRSKYEVAYY